mmetsp:Transcript_21/g.61  ORF Transcript_21/g.61 Transcript_21/m.61 type:complete len:912 (-) Transcript_21:21-2756(-)
MKFNYKLHRLCGAYYGCPATTNNLGPDGRRSGSNLIYTSDGNVLMSAVSNRVQVLDLHTHTVRTLPLEARSNIRCLALSPDDALLIAVDVHNYAMIINFNRGIVLNRFKFKRKVGHIVFSPCGKYIAVTQGKYAQVWIAPNHMRKEFSPLSMHKQLGGQSADLTHLGWSSDSSVLIGCSKDCTARIWAVNTTVGYVAVTLSGHKTPIVGAYFTYNYDQSISGCYTISEDGALVTWEADKGGDDPAKYGISQTLHPPSIDGKVEHALDFFSGNIIGSQQSANVNPAQASSERQSVRLVNTEWSVKTRHYFKQDGADTVSASYSSQSQILAVGFSSGIFGLYEMPSVSNIHTLSVGSDQLIRACTLNNTGEWLALGCPPSQQLLVWEWRSESYVLKQRGHAYGMRCMAYSPDNIAICTGGEDGKVKLWNSTSGFCYVTMEQSHQAPVTAVSFASASVVMSASLDGTVRAHDLHRYRTFKTYTTPKPTQLLSLSVDPSGEIVAAGSMDPFHVYAWNMQTGKLLDVFTGHEGPVACLSFQGSGGILASASWDGTVKTWDMYKGDIPTESLRHSTDVVCLAWRPDGREICTGTIGGLLSFWDVETSKMKFEIDGRRDIAGGRKLNDRMTAANNQSSRYFTSVCYSADGCFVLAGGNSKFVCIYEVEHQMLLKKFQVSFNRSLDGTLDQLNSKGLADYGPTDENGGSEDEATYNSIRLPGARRGDDGSRKNRAEVLTFQVSFSSTGREWAAVSGDGLHVYSLDEDMLFDPISLAESITPASVESKLALREYGSALAMALHLNELSLVECVLDNTPHSSIRHVAKGVHALHVERLLQFLTRVVSTTPHIEFYIEWCCQLLQSHGLHMERHRSSVLMQSFRALRKVVQAKHDEFKTIIDENKYNLDFVDNQAKLMADAD